MIPLGRPRISFSTRWPSLAISAADHSTPESLRRTWHAATSMAADDDSPAPIGTSVAMEARLDDLVSCEFGGDL